MLDVLCKWLNEELRLSKYVDQKTFAKDFSSGYYIGEVLNKYHLQNDLHLFTKRSTAVSKVNNFRRLQPTLQILGISLDADTVQGLMQEKHGVATHLLYRLYVALQQKKKAEVYCLSSNNILTPAAVHVPKPPPYTTLLSMKAKQKQDRREIEAERVQAEIAFFENNKKKLVPTGFASNSLVPGCETSKNGLKVNFQSNSRYIQEIRQRLKENAIDNEHRQKRRDRFLVKQLKSQEVHQERQREEQLVRRLTRQTQQEQRLAVQLLQIRMQKDVIRENRLFRERQYQEQREKDFQDALDREAALVQQAKLDHAEEIRLELDCCKRIAVERAQNKRNKFFNNCREILGQIIDLATKVSEFCSLTGTAVPAKMMREWRELMMNDLPLYEEVTEDSTQPPEFEFPTLDETELKKLELLNNQDYDEYIAMSGEWAWPAEAGDPCQPPANNNILGHVVANLKKLVEPPAHEQSKPKYPHFRVKACMLGKFCAGKTTCLTTLAKTHTLHVLCAETLIKEALMTFLNVAEEIEQLEEAKGKPSTAIQEQERQEERLNFLLTKQVILGRAADREMREGHPVSNELVVDIIAEAIRQLPAESGWILDGFPVDVDQAHLLEDAISGTPPTKNEVVIKRTDLAIDPNPPKPPPPPPPAFDLIVLLEIPDECVVKRAVNKPGHDTMNTDNSLLPTQIPHRISAFQETWPALEEWFGTKQNILHRINAELKKKDLYKKVETIFVQIMTQKHLAKLALEEMHRDHQKSPDSMSSYSSSSSDSPGHTRHEHGHADSHHGHSKEGHSRNASHGSNHDDLPSRDHGHAKNIHESFHPGSASWVYVDVPLPPEVPKFLHHHWAAVCEAYVTNIQRAMQELRTQRTVVNRHIYNIREEFKHYLGRPDLKQEIVSQWQKDFNNMPDDMRDDDDTKAELHQRLDELREQLWEISDTRKAENEEEWTTLMLEGWLEDHTASIINHHSRVTQVELNRFQDTLCILRDYYLSMYGQVPPAPLFDWACIPLIVRPEFMKFEESTAETSDGCPEEKKKQTESSFRVFKFTGDDQMEILKTLHDKLKTDHEEALSAINKLVSSVLHLGVSEIKEQKEVPHLSPTHDPHKKRDTPSPTLTGSPTHDEKKTSPHHDKIKNKEVRNKIHKEYKAGLNHEGQSAKVRIALVKGHGLVLVESLKNRAKQIFENMKECLEAHYLAEMKSINQLALVVRHHIESGAKLQNEIVLECTDFYIDGDCQVLANAPPPPRPLPLEKAMQSTLTVVQLESLYHNFRHVAPSGFLSSSDFFHMMRDIISINIGMTSFPDTWTTMTDAQLSEITVMLTDEYELIDWRQFLLSAALPWPFPGAAHLLLVLQRFTEADTHDTGFVTKEQFLDTELWFSNESAQSASEDPLEPLPYDRLANLRKFFFQLFAEHCCSSAPRLDYRNMLQYFATDPNPKQGFIRALSLRIGQSLRQPVSSQLVMSMNNLEESSEFSSSDYIGECIEKITPCATSNSAEEEQLVSIPCLLSVISHKLIKSRDSLIPPGCKSLEQNTEYLESVFIEMGFKPDDYVPYSILSQHPAVEELMEGSLQHQLINIHRVLQQPNQDDSEGSPTID
ncbi:sperm flagellar protein 2 [Synchiropus picturatus]